MRNTIIYVIITCIVSWLFAGICYLSGLMEGYLFQIVGMIYMLFPAIVAICLQKFYLKQPVIKNLKISFKFNKWFIVAIILPVFIVGLTILVSVLFPGVHFSPDGEGYFERFAGLIPDDQMAGLRQQMLSFNPVLFLLIGIGAGIVAGSTINSVFAFGEELGWRGYMLNHLSKYSYAKVSLFTGIIWGIWHFPLILMGHNYPQHPVLGVLFMTIFCVIFSFIFTYIVIKSKSVITAALLHGNFNAVAGLTIFYLSGGNDLLVGTMGITGFIAMSIIILLFFIYDKKITKENIFTKQVAFD